MCCPINRFTVNDLPPRGKCGTQAKDRIVGGEETSISDFPWYGCYNYVHFLKNKNNSLLI